MKKNFIKWTMPVDKTLTEIGRFVLTRPWFSLMILTSVALSTFLGSVWENSETDFSAPEIAHSIASEPEQTDQHGLLPEWVAFSVRPGETIATIFERYHLDQNDLTSILALKKAESLRNLSADRVLTLTLRKSGQLDQLSYDFDDTHRLQVERGASGFLAHIESISPNSNSETTQNVEPKAQSSGEAAKSLPFQSASTEIKHSLVVDAKKAGLPATVVRQLVALFNHKGILQQIRPGDRLNVFYETLKIAEKTTTQIVAAELALKKNRYQLIRFKDPKGGVHYYTPDGSTFQEGLTRAPLHYREISSRFSMHRFHPLMGYTRPHLGVDYAAPYGTPVRAAGDGKIMQTGYRGGYGNSIIIQHNQNYETLYGHLSHIARSIRPGMIIKKGDVIGYVGSTGLSTGPHLHYEIHQNGIPRNPLTVTLPSASIPRAWKAKFLLESRSLLAQLKAFQRTQYAENAKPPTKPTKPTKRS